MRKTIDIRKAVEKIIDDKSNGEKSACVLVLVLEVLLDIREKLCKQNEMIRRGGRS